jgi:two-component system, cell cycle response regulator
MDVLIADDDPVSRRLLQVSLGHAGYNVISASNGAEALRALDAVDYPRLCVLDWMMPELDGVDVCRMIRERAREPYVYVILLTSKAGQKEIVEGLESGADDYIVKPFDLHKLKARLRSGERILDLHEQLVSARELLRTQATHDSLTGLLNRGAILDLLNKELSRAARKKESVALIMADLDHFKRINDAHGHQAGDAVLREAASRMQAALREYDAIGRYGGEEFLVVSAQCGPAEAVALAERLRERVAAAPVVFADRSVSITVSLGVAAAVGDWGRPEELLRAADEALYAAKDRGRNRVEAHAKVFQ